MFRTTVMAKHDDVISKNYNFDKTYTVIIFCMQSIAVPDILVGLEVFETLS